MNVTDDVERLRSWDLGGLMILVDEMDMTGARDGDTPENVIRRVADAAFLALAQADLVSLTYVNPEAQLRACARAVLVSLKQHRVQIGDEGLTGRLEFERNVNAPLRRARRAARRANQPQD